MTADALEVMRCYNAMMTIPGAVFVFGSNLKGVHGGGAARDAFDRYGATWGQGEGLQGRSYAIPTKRTPGQKMTLAEAAEGVARFLLVARATPDTIYVVSRVGCGLAGFTDADIAPLFALAPANCLLPEGWR